MEAARHLYIHVPFCDGKCAYCGFYSVPLASAGEWVDGWLDGVAREMDALLPSGASPFSVYVGGGTPTVLEPSHLQRLCRLIGERSGGGAPREWTVEANPGTLSREKLDILTAAQSAQMSYAREQKLDLAALYQPDTPSYTAALNLLRASARDYELKNKTTSADILAQYLMFLLAQHEGAAPEKKPVKRNKTESAPAVEPAPAESPVAPAPEAVTPPPPAAEAPSVVEEAPKRLSWR